MFEQHLGNGHADQACAHWGGSSGRLRDCPCANYEVWAIDQGTATVHVYNDRLEETAKLDLSSHGVRVPHMVDFTPDGAYALIAATASGNVSVIRAADRQVVAVLPTGPASHAATVRPDGRQAIVSVIGDPKVERDGKLVEIRIDFKQGSSS